MRTETIFNEQISNDNLKNDWQLDEILELFELPFADLIFSATK